METVSVSPEFRVVVPRRIREALGLKPRQKLQARQYTDRVELIPVLPLASARGFLAGLETDIDREGDRA